MGRNMTMAFCFLRFAMMLAAILVCPSGGIRIGPTGLNSRSHPEHLEDLKHLVPTGPDPSEPSESPSDDLWPLFTAGPNFEQPLDSRFGGMKPRNIRVPPSAPSDGTTPDVPVITFDDSKPLVPKGPDPIEPPKTPSNDLRRLVPGCPNHEQPLNSRFGGMKPRNIRVPSSVPSDGATPNAPMVFNYGKHLVSGGPNPEQPHHGSSGDRIGGMKRRIIHVSPSSAPSHTTTIYALDGTHDQNECFVPHGAIPQQSQGRPFLNQLSEEESLFEHATPSVLLHGSTTDESEGLEHLVLDGPNPEQPPESSDVPFPHKGSPWSSDAFQFIF